MDGTSAEVHQDGLTNRVDIKTPKFIEKPPSLEQHLSATKSRNSEGLKFTIWISSSSRSQYLGSRSASWYKQNLLSTSTLHAHEVPTVSWFQYDTPPACVLLTACATLRA